MNSLQGKHHPWNRLDIVGWTLQGQESGVFEAARIWTSVGDWYVLPRSCIILFMSSGDFGQHLLVRVPSIIWCTGPFKVNGVPLRRVNQAYVISTSTKVDISSVDLKKFTDVYFKREVEKKKKSEGQFFEAEKEVEFLTWAQFDLYSHCMLSSSLLISCTVSVVVY